MWTPKRLALFALGYGLFLSAYFGYSLSPFGGIDGLPPLPELYWPKGDSPADSDPLPARRSNLDGKLRMAFGEGSPELMRPIRLELISQNMALAADQFQIEPDGRVCLTPLSVALFSKEKTPGKSPDVNTLRCQVAYLQFDRPVHTLSDIGNRKVIGAEISGNIQVVNNRRTTARDDDICIFINQGPLYYEEANHRIWTHDAIHLLDHNSKPKPIEVRGKGMVMDLDVGAPPATPAPGAKGKERTPQINGVKRITLQSNVDMHLYIDGKSGFPSGNRPTKPAPAPTAGIAAPPAAKSHVAIKTPGQFIYDIYKDHDTARFEAPAAKSAGYPQDVTVTRDLETTNKVDQLICKRLDLRLRRKDKDAPQAVVDGARPEQGIEIDTARATGSEVTLYSDEQSFEAHGNDFLYDAKQQMTTLKGEPHMLAIRDGSTIRARELQVQEQKMPVVPGQPQRSFHQSTAIGPVSIEMIDSKNKAGSKPLHAACSEKLIATKDGQYDLLILSGSARFTDEEHQQHLQGEVIKVWLHPDDRDGPAKPAATPRANATAASPSRRPHHLEAIENVVAVSPELNIHDTARLVVWFKDVPPETLLPPAAPPQPPRGNEPPDRTPTLTVPAPGKPTPPYQVNKAVVPTPATPTATTPPGASPPAPEPRSALGVPRNQQDQRPIDLSAHSVEAWVLRAGVKNQLEKIWTQGKVQVRQDPARPEEKGVDIRGETLEMNCRPEGNLLVVTGDLAQLRMDKIYILGPEVNIDQAANKAWVNGSGAMQMDSSTTFQGDRLDRTVPLTIHWNKSMLFNGKFAEFHGGIQAEQENSRMAGQSLQVFFDRPISLKEGNKGPQPRVQNLVVDRDVRIEENVYEGTRLLKSQSIRAPVVAVDANEPDDDDPRRKDPKAGNTVRASGPGSVRIFQLGGDVMTAPGEARPVSRPAGANNRAESAQEMKLTYVSFLKSMYANSRSNTANFIENVRVLHLPTDDPNLEIDLDSMLDKLPVGAMYLRADRLDVFSRGEKGRSNQEMLAKGRCLIQARDFWGRAPTVSYNEAKEQVIFEGDSVNPAVLYKVPQRGGTPQIIKAKKIIYLRKTGETKVDEVQSIDVQDAAGAGVPLPK